MRRRNLGTQREETPRICMHRGKSICGHREKVVISKPRKEEYGETDSVGTLILDF